MPKPRGTPKDALDFAIAFEEGSLRQKSYGETKIEIKTEPVCIVNKKKDYLRCGMKNFTMDHLKVCRATTTRSKNTVTEFKSRQLLNRRTEEHSTGEDEQPTYSRNLETTKLQFYINTDFFYRLPFLCSIPQQDAELFY